LGFIRSVRQGLWSERSCGPTKSYGEMKLCRKMRERVGFNLPKAVCKNPGYLEFTSEITGSFQKTWKASWPPPPRQRI